MEWDDTTEGTFRSPSIKAKFIFSMTIHAFDVQSRGLVETWRLVI